MKVILARSLRSTQALARANVGQTLPSVNPGRGFYGDSPTNVLYSTLVTGARPTTLATSHSRQTGAVHRPFRQRVRQRMMQALNLTPAQREQAKTIFQQARQNAQPFTQQLRQNRHAMAVAVKANDAAKIQQLAMERGHLTGQVMADPSQATARVLCPPHSGQRAKADQCIRGSSAASQQRDGSRTNGTGTRLTTKPCS